jgi:hypothetical protein
MLDRSGEIADRVREWHAENPHVRVEASERMTLRNPMRDAAVREKQTNTLRAMGHRPPVQGGNGKGMSVPQALLLGSLGEGWVAEHIVKTSCQRVNVDHLPSHYKIDLAFADRMIAVEVDGSSHQSLVGQQRDRKKDAFLAALGWRVFRVRNRQILNDMESVVKEIMSGCTT